MPIFSALPTDHPAVQGNHTIECQPPHFATSSTFKWSVLRVAGKTFEGSNRIILICLGEDTSCVAVLLCYCVTVLLLLLSTFDDVEESAAYTASPAQCGATRRGGTTPTTTRWRPSPPSRGPRTNSPAWSWEPRPPSHPPQHVILSSRFTFSFMLAIKKL